MMLKKNPFKWFIFIFSNVTKQSSNRGDIRNITIAKQSMVLTMCNRYTHFLLDDHNQNYSNVVIHLISTWNYKHNLSGRTTVKNLNSDKTSYVFPFYTKISDLNGKKRTLEKKPKQIDTIIKRVSTGIIVWICKE